MKLSIDYDVIQDLLPLYVDNVASEATKIIVEQHMQSCENCKEALAEMENPITVEHADEKELDYMKTIRKKIKKSYLISIIALTAVALTAIVILSFIFIVGQPTDLANLNFAYYYSAEDNAVVVTGDLLLDNYAVGGVNVYPVDNKNVVQIKVNKVKPSFIYNAKEFSVKIPWNDEFMLEIQEDGNRETIMYTDTLYPYISQWSDYSTYNTSGVLMNKSAIGEIKSIIKGATPQGAEPFESVNYQELAGTDKWYPKAADYINISFIDTEKYGILERDYYQWQFNIYEAGGKYYVHSPNHEAMELTESDYKKLSGYIHNVETDNNVRSDVAIDTPYKTLEISDPMVLAVLKTGEDGAAHTCQFGFFIEIDTILDEDGKQEALLLENIDRVKEIASTILGESTKVDVQSADFSDEFSKKLKDSINIELKTDCIKKIYITEFLVQ